MRPPEVRVRPDQGSVAGADLGHAQGDRADVTDREPVLERRPEEEDEHRQQRAEGQPPSHPAAPDGVSLGGRGVAREGGLERGREGEKILRRRTPRRRGIGPAGELHRE